jgi:hypothetical protein
MYDAFTGHAAGNVDESLDEKERKQLELGERTVRENGKTKAKTRTVVKENGSNDTTSSRNTPVIIKGDGDEEKGQSNKTKTGDLVQPEESTDFSCKDSAVATKDDESMVQTDLMGFSNHKSMITMNSGQIVHGSDGVSLILCIDIDSPKPRTPPHEPEVGFRRGRSVYRQEHGDLSFCISYF